MWISIALVSFQAAFAMEELDEAMEAPCEPTQIQLTTPAANATEVPVDVELSAILSGDCGGSATWLFDLTKAADDTLVGTYTYTVSGALPVRAVMPLEADLPEDTALVLTITDGDGQLAPLEVHFTTGIGRVTPLSGEPTATVRQASWNESTGGAFLIVDAVAAPDPDGLSLLKFDFLGTTTYAAAADGSDQMLSGFISGQPEVLCVNVTQIDGGGVSSAPTEVCAATEDIEIITSENSGCGSKNVDVAAPVEGFAFFGLIGFLRRRRKA